MAQDRQRVKYTRRLSSQFVTQLPDTLWQMIDKHRHLTITKLLINPTTATGEIAILAKISSLDFIP